MFKITDKGYFIIGVIDLISATFALFAFASRELLMLTPFAGLIAFGGLALILSSIKFNKKQKREEKH